jgi:alkanesulfonate monooxygenase SsuD/methylene tetrahydromethanopterin reductase-like flavin-dependent oxidoreductase (luciferase family)
MLGHLLSTFRRLRLRFWCSGAQATSTPDFFSTPSSTYHRQGYARGMAGVVYIIRLLRDEEPVSFGGEFYRLHDAVLMPSSTITIGTPIVIGGNGPNRTLPLVAPYTDARNAVFVPAKRFVELSTYLNELLRAVGRSPERVRRTLMTRVIFGRTTMEVERKLGGERESDSAPMTLSGRHLRSSSSSAR